MKVSFTKHAITRYRQRVKPLITDAQALVELKALVKLADGFGDCPLPDHENSDYFMEIAPGIWLGLAQNGQKFTALTCITNSGFSEERRAARNKHKAGQRARRRTRARHDRVTGGRRPEQGWAA